MPWGGFPSALWCTVRLCCISEQIAYFPTFQNEFRALCPVLPQTLFLLASLEEVDLTLKCFPVLLWLFKVFLTKSKITVISVRLMKPRDELPLFCSWSFPFIADSDDGLPPGHMGNVWRISFYNLCTCATNIFFRHPSFFFFMLLSSSHLWLICVVFEGRRRPVWHVLTW